ncbi:MAG: LLM class flavin-dependent oxidoreductase [Dehalococcoidia bacterium]|nr:LLM class flavin-dependent oxidoreductase [Dehalococcoidia bacterium]
MTNRKLRFGAVLSLGLGETAAEARWLEELGYDYSGSGEHFMRGDPPKPSSAALSALAVAGGATEGIGLVSSVILLPFYHPTVLAKLATTMDIATNGRLVLGVGVGGEFPVEFEAAGLSVKQRGIRSDECLEVLRRLWTKRGVDYVGRHFSLKGVTIEPPPHQQPHPPVWVAGRRDAAMKRAARLGDGWLPYLYSPERYRASVSHISSLATGSGRDMSGFAWANFQFISIGASREQAAEDAATALGGQYLYQGNFLDIVGGYCVLGTPADCIRRIQEYVDAGVEHFLFNWACPPEEVPRHIESVAKEIIPHFRD